MKRIAFLFALVAASTMSLMAQNGNLSIKGSVYDFDSAEPLFPANIQIYELTDELEEFLVTQIFPEYKSSVVRIELLPEDVELRFA